MIEALLTWLKTFPLWEESLSVDYLETVPGAAAIYPEGLEEVQRQEDILGNVTAVNRLHFVLYRVSAGQQDNQQNSQWLLEFQGWIQQQSAAGLAPHFGDVPEREKITAQGGKLKSAAPTGIGTYAVTVTAEFIKHYKK